MPAANFDHRLPDNVPGKYYVDDQCLDCDLCRETAPTVFRRKDSNGHSFVMKQPQTAEEFAQANEAMEGCPCEAIFADGDEFEWPDTDLQPLPAWRTGLAKKPVCRHCGGNRRPWWRFW
ncbi:ferredoxin [Luteolibacter sp. SL250]|uniref:ferredoxin n=1 Tax=Luteolibacter sp. SL250 TaxID=2995170 RepID=UPI00226F8997|nr:ferredoxin [Luteolibacter sp. SL250]WAC19118.1 ferredoxin [Luteolibacter sp. SL250]